MIIFPAIDLKGGQAVRLRQGAMDSATVFNDSPAAQARLFTAQGFGWLHIVDLDGAFGGQPVNRCAVRDILSAVSCPVQLGGGIRDLSTIEQWLDAGVRRVILGTVAVTDPALVKRACASFPGQIVVGLDARGGYVVTDGWAQSSDLSAVDLARCFEDAGIAAIVYTDIDRDGMMGGCNVDQTAALARAVSVPVVASGGVASLDDLRALKAVEDCGIEGVICGRALYDGGLDPAAARALAEGRL